MSRHQIQSLIVPWLLLHHYQNVLFVYADEAHQQLIDHPYFYKCLEKNNFRSQQQNNNFNPQQTLTK